MFRWLHTSLVNHEALLINWIQNKGQWTRLTDTVKPPLTAVCWQSESRIPLLLTTPCYVQCPAAKLAVSGSCCGRLQHADSRYVRGQYRSPHVAGNMVGVRFADSVEMAEREGNGFDKTETDAFIQDARSPSFDMDRDPAARPRNAQAKRRLIQSSMIPWILTCLFALTSFLLLLERYGIRKFGTYEDRLSTDLCMCAPDLFAN